MPTITTQTRALVALLGDLVLTSCPDPEFASMYGVLLHTDVGELAIDSPEGDRGLIETIETKLLIGTSFDRTVTAQTHIPAEFDSIGWSRAILIPTESVDIVVREFGKRYKSFGRNIPHKAILELAGDRLTVREDPRQIPDGLSITFTVSIVDDAPHMTDDPYVMATGPDGEVLPDALGRGWSAYHLLAFGKIAERRGMPAAIYTHHHTRPAIVEIGGSYRAVAAPYKLDEDNRQNIAPMVRVFDPPRSRLAAVPDGD